MGALCGKEEHFDRLGQGHVLGASSSAGPTATADKSKSQALALNRPAAASAVTDGSPKPLSTDTGPRRDDDSQRREALLKAAEERNKAAASRGGSGKLSSQLASQKSDGGRAQQAIQEGQNKDNEPLRWD
ncbi:hypothetical protein OIV83_006117 [Microbotryomycetes sp. JL201]|nr:hypothetical protein OIV83_006117 [Microbotryomycetes sp. JL201]